MTNKILTILEARDHLEVALNKNLGKVNQLDKATDRLGKGMGRAFNAFDQQVSKFQAKGAILADTVSGFIPGLDALGPALVSPWGAAAAGVAIVATGLGVAADRAAEFEERFLKLENLNLDKPIGQVNQLKQDVLKLALDTGKNAGAVSDAYFDIQSATGQYGDEVEKAIRKIGAFSKATKTDFNTAVQGSVKNVLNYNLTLADLDRVLASNFKTVQTGIVTFDQLAKVQVDYAGAANAAGQSIESSNKLFTIFTQKTKSVEEAATLTKSALLDLLKPETLKTFEKFGVQAFDKNTGRVKQLDKLVEELNEKFRAFRGNDRKITNLINQFSGSEGLVALIGEAAKNGDNMLRTFNAFDNVSFEFDKALANSEKNARIIGEEVRNKWNTILIGIGEKVLPTINNVLTRISDNMGGIQSAIEKTSDFTVTWWKRLGVVKDVLTGVGGAAFRKVRDLAVDNFFSEEEDPLAQPRKAESMGRVAAIKKLAEGGKPTASPSAINTKAEQDLLKLANGKGGGKLSGDVRGVVAGGDQVRNITVHIAKQVAIENLNSTNVTDGPTLSKLRQALSQLLVESVRDSEIAIAR